MASMLRNNPQLVNLYAGYDDGSFVGMDMIDRAGPKFRESENAPEDSVYRLVVIPRTNLSNSSMVIFLSDNLTHLSNRPGPSDYDPRRRPWYSDALKGDNSLLTGPYVFYGIGQPGYTLRLALREGRRGVVAGDILVQKAEAMLFRQRLGKSGTDLRTVVPGDQRAFNYPREVAGLEQGARLRAARRKVLDRPEGALRTASLFFWHAEVLGDE